jgi:hypothetical protein
LSEAVACDRCGCSLSGASGSDYRLRLTCEPLFIRPSAEPLYGERPLLDRDLYFCGMHCLREWALA